MTLEDFRADAALFEAERRGIEVARALDSKAPIPYATTIEVESHDVEDFFAALTPKRFQILKLSRKMPRSIAELARAAKRDPSAVSKDVSALESLGLVSVVEEPHAGHGVKKVVRPAASTIEVHASLFN